MTLNIVIIILLILIPILLIYKLKKLNYNFLLNVKYLIIIYSYFYILLPSLFIEVTNRVQKWNFSNNSMFFSKLGSIYFVTAILVIAIFWIKDKKYEISNSIKINYKTNIFITCLWWIVFIYSIVVTIDVANILISIRATGFDRILFGNALYQLTQKYNLQSVLFLGLTVSSIKYWHKNGLVYYLPLLIISINDLIAGGRTFIFFTLLVIYYNTAIKNKKLYLVPIILFATFILISVTTSRMDVQLVDSSMGQVSNFIYQSIGEFIQPFNGFVYTIENAFSANNGIIDGFMNIIQGILPGFLKVNLGFNSYFPGEILATEINRGYGLGFNIMAEALYYGGPILFLLYPIIVTCTSSFIGNLFLKMKFPGYIFFLYYINYIRQFFREGFLIYLLIPLYLFIVYGSISFLISKTRVIGILKNKKMKTVVNHDEKIK